MLIGLIYWIIPFAFSYNPEPPFWGCQCPQNAQPSHANHWWKCPTVLFMIQSGEGIFSVQAFSSCQMTRELSIWPKLNHHIFISFFLLWEGVLSRKLQNCSSIHLSSSSLSFFTWSSLPFIYRFSLSPLLHSLIFGKVSGWTYATYMKKMTYVLAFLKFYLEKEYVWIYEGEPYISVS